MANSVDLDEMPHFVASHLGLYCLLRPVCTNTYGKYGKICEMNDMDPDCIELYRKVKTNGKKSQLACMDV